MNCFCVMVYPRKEFRLISCWDHDQRSSLSWISDTLRAGFKPTQNLSSDLLEWVFAVVITTTPRRHTVPVLKVIVKFCNHLSISAIRNAFNPPQNVRIIRQNADIFWSYICHLFNVCIDKGTSPSVLKFTIITPVFKKTYRGSKKATERWVFCLSSPKVSKSCYATIYHPP